MAFLASGRFIRLPSFALINPNGIKSAVRGNSVQQYGQSGLKFRDFSMLMASRNHDSVHGGSHVTAEQIAGDGRTGCLYFLKNIVAFSKGSNVPRGFEEFKNTPNPKGKSGDRIIEDKHKSNRRSDESHNDNGSQKSDNDMPFGFGFYTNKSKSPVLLYVVVATAFITLFLYSSQGTVITWKVFETELLAKNLVDKLVVSNNEVTVFLRPGAEAGVNNISVRSPVYRFRIGSVDSFERMLEKVQSELGRPRSEYVSVYYEGNLPWSSILLSILPPLIYVGIFYYLFRNVSVGTSGSKNIFSIAESRAKLYKRNSKVDVKFKDVAGIDEVKEEVQEFVKFLDNPSKYESLGAKIPKGAILSGPPGTGKTLLAKATAGEADVPFYFISGSEFIEMFAGVGASRVRDLFETAKKNSPCIIFIDEIDAIGKARGRSSISPGGIDERESTLNQLLVEMDGFSSRDYVIVFAGTNRPDTLDPALLRPGRFDRHITLDLPTAKGRKEIINVHMAPLKTSVDSEKFPELLASMTAGFSGADLRNLCNEAALIAARKDSSSVEEGHFFTALDRVIAGAEKRSVILSNEEKKIVAYHEAGHAVAGWFLRHARPLQKISIIPRTSGALGFTHFLSEEKYLQNPSQFMDMMCTLLGGRASEQVFFKTVTSGASDDIKKVTHLAYLQIKAYGMSDLIGNINYMHDNDLGNSTFYKPYSEETSKLIDKEVNKMVSFAYTRTLNLIKEKVLLVQVVAERLLEKEVLEIEELVSILGPRIRDEKEITPISVVDTASVNPGTRKNSDGNKAPVDTCVDVNEQVVPRSC